MGENVCHGTSIPDGQVVHFDHIRAFTSGGVTELDNIAPMCETHNKAKGALPLEDFRVRIRLQDFFSHGDAVTLKHLLAYMKKSGDITGYGQTVVVNEEQGDHTVTLEAGNAAYSYDLYTCPTTGWKYFYATLPVACSIVMTMRNTTSGYNHASSYLTKCLNCIGTSSGIRYCSLQSVA